MSVTVQILDGPLSPVLADVAWPCHGHSAHGASLSFEGIVRPTENTQTISALVYEAYEPMATAELRRLAEGILAGHGLLAIAVEHSRGRVPAGECSFRLRILSRHRKEALAAMDEFIDRMKQDVPIWKAPEFCP